MYENHNFHFIQNSTALVNQRDAQLRCMIPLWLAVILTLSWKVSGLECHFVVWLNDKWIALSASNRFILHFSSGGITISFPEMGLSGLSVQAKIEILLAKHVSVCVYVSLCASVHGVWVLLLRGRRVLENQGLPVVTIKCVCACVCIYVCVYLFVYIFILSDRFQLNVFQL